MDSIAANKSRLSINIESITGEIRLTRISGVSAISRPFYYDIQWASKSPIFELNNLLNKAVTVTLHDTANRFIRGYIQEVGFINQGTIYGEYGVRIVPKLWWLGLRKNMRLFQDLRPTEIIANLLKEHGITEDEFQINADNIPVRPYCVQYAETDLQFVNRLMEEEGLHYHFQNDANQQILRICHSDTQFARKSGSIQVRYSQEISRPHGEEVVHKATYRAMLKPNGIRLGDYNRQKPELELNQMAHDGRGDRQHYRHPGHFDTPQRGKHLASLQLEQQQSQRQQVEMETHSVHCAAGHWFQMTHHCNPQLNTRFLIVESALEAQQPQSLDASAGDLAGTCMTKMRCIPLSVNYRPAKDHPKPVAAGPHHGRVVGPKNEEIYCDSQGRIKVQLIWDRHGENNEHSSCWIPVNQPLAGLQWGGITLPRTGQEVIIEFEHGDPDRPVMVGRVYNDQNPPPQKLPQQKTVSSFKTQSSPNGSGYNEIMLDDKKGAEQIGLRAEKNLDLRTQRRYRRQIQANLKEITHGHFRQELRQDLHQCVKGNSKMAIAHGLNLTIAKDLYLEVTGAHVTKADNAFHIKAGSSVVLEAQNSLTVKAGSGTICLDQAGVSIQGSLVRINEGGSPMPVILSNPTLPGSPAEALNDQPGAVLQKTSSSTIPTPPPLDIDRTQAQRTMLEEANALDSPFLENCEECQLRISPTESIP